MTVQMVLLPVFVLVGLTFALLLMTRGRAAAKEGSPGIAGDLFGLPTLFYVLIALARPLNQVDYVILMLSWVFVITQFAHAGIFLTSNDSRQRGLAWYAGVLVLFAMWLYFALKLLLLI